MLKTITSSTENEILFAIYIVSVLIWLFFIISDVRKDGIMHLSDSLIGFILTFTPLLNTFALIIFALVELDRNDYVLWERKE